MSPDEIRNLNKALKDLVDEIKKDRNQRSSESSGFNSSLGRDRVGSATDVSPMELQKEKIKQLMIEKEMSEDILEIALLRKEDMEEMKKKQDDLVEQLDKQLRAQQAVTGLTGDALKKHQEGLVALQEDIDFQKEKKKILDLQTKSRRDGIQLTEDENDWLEKALDKHKQITKEMEKQRKETLSIRDAKDGAEELVGSFAGMMGIQEPKEGGITSVVGGLIKGGDAAEAVMSGLTAGVGRFLNWQALAISAVQKLGEFVVFATLKFDKMAASLAATTGQGRDYFAATIEMSAGTRGVVASTGELVEQAGKLQNSLAGLQGMSRGQVSQFAEVGLAVERLGVSTDDYTSILSHQMTVMGKTGPEAQETMGTLQTASNQLGMSFGELSSMMASSQKDFSSFGANADKVFLKTAGTARQLGMEIGDLVELGKKFDTFDSAASSVADLNYLMGGQFLDTMEMMSVQNEEGPAGVAAKIKEQFDATGKSIEDMSRHQRMAMAEAAGMDEATMTKFLTGEIDESQLEGLGEAVDPMTRLAETANQTLDFFSGIGKAVMAFADNLAMALGLDQLGEMMSDIFGGGSGGMMDMMKNVFEFMEPTFGFIRRAIAMVIKRVKPLVSVLGSMIKIMWAILKPVIAIGRIITGVIFDVAEVMLDVFMWPLEKVAMVAELIADTFSIVGELAYDVVQAIGAPILGLTGFIRDTWIGVRDIIEMPFKLAFDLVKDLLGYIKTGVDSFGNALASGSKRITERVLSPFIALKDLIVGFFAETIPNAIKDGLMSGIDWIKEKLLALVSWIPGLGPDDDNDAPQTKTKPATESFFSSWFGDDEEEKKKPKPVTASQVVGGMANASAPKKSSAMTATMIGGIVVEKNGVPVPLTPEEASKVEALNSVKIPSERYDVGRNPIKGGGPKQAPNMPASSTVRPQPQAQSSGSGTSSASDTNVAINVNSRKLAEVFEVVVEDVITGNKAGSSIA